MGLPERHDASLSRNWKLGQDLTNTASFRTRSYSFKYKRTLFVFTSLYQHQSKLQKQISNATKTTTTILENAKSNQNNNSKSDGITTHLRYLGDRLVFDNNGACKRHAL